MLVFLAAIASLALWTLLWGLDLMKSFDAFIVSMLIVILAATARLLVPYLPGGGR
jgi:hypothetical protein